MAVVHAAKTCHSRYLGYRGSLAKTDPNYLFVERENDLYLNLIDPVLPLFMPESFSQALSFIDRHPDGILIHCNEGLSRAPSLALVYLASWGEIANGSYNEARKSYLKLDPLYAPGQGIVKYLTAHWADVIARKN